MNFTDLHECSCLTHDAHYNDSFASIKTICTMIISSTKILQHFYRCLNSKSTLHKLKNLITPTPNPRFLYCNPIKTQSVSIIDYRKNDSRHERKNEPWIKSHVSKKLLQKSILRGRMKRVHWHNARCQFSRAGSIRSSKWIRGIVHSGDRNWISRGFKTHRQPANPLIWPVSDRVAAPQSPGPAIQKPQFLEILFTAPAYLW